MVQNERLRSFYLQLSTYGLIVKKVKLLGTILYAKAFILFGVVTNEKNMRKPSRQLKKIKEFSYKIRFSKSLEELFKWK